MNNITRIDDKTWETAQSGEINYWREKHAKDGEPFKRKRYLSILQPHIGDTSHLVVVDVGAGPKGILHMIPFRVGIAVDPLMKKFKDAGYDLESERFACVEGAGENLPLPNDYADQTYSLNALDHSMNASAMFAEMVRITKAEGLICLIVDFRFPENRTTTHQMCLSYDFFDRAETVHALGRVARENVKKCSGTAETGFLGVWRKTR